MKADQTTSHSLESGRTLYVHVVLGAIKVNGEPMAEGDGATVKKVNDVEFVGVNNSEALVFDLT